MSMQPQESTVDTRQRKIGPVLHGAERTRYLLQLEISEEDARRPTRLAYQSISAPPLKRSDPGEIVTHYELEKLVQLFLDAVIPTALSRHPSLTH